MNNRWHENKLYVLGKADRNNIPRIFSKYSIVKHKINIVGQINRFILKLHTIALICQTITNNIFAYNIMKILVKHNDGNMQKISEYIHVE